MLWVWKVFITFTCVWKVFIIFTCVWKVWFLPVKQSTAWAWGIARGLIFLTSDSGCFLELRALQDAASLAPQKLEHKILLLFSCYSCVLLDGLFKLLHQKNTLFSAYQKSAIWFICTTEFSHLWSINWFSNEVAQNSSCMYQGRQIKLSICFVSEEVGKQTWSLSESNEFQSQKAQEFKSMISTEFHFRSSGWQQVSRAGSWECAGSEEADLWRRQDQVGTCV